MHTHRHTHTHRHAHAHTNDRPDTDVREINMTMSANTAASHHIPVIMNYRYNKFISSSGPFADNLYTASGSRLASDPCKEKEEKRRKETRMEDEDGQKCRSVSRLLILTARRRMTPQRCSPLQLGLGED